MSTAVRFKDVSIIFGPNPKSVLARARAGDSRDEIQKETGHVLGVTGCSLDVQEGEIVVLMGLSGSGKSTLLRAVNLLNPITDGEVEIQCEGSTVNVGQISSEELRRIRMERVAMVFQQFGLLPWRSVRENIGLGLELAGVGIKERQECVDKQLQLIGLEQWADRRVQELSGGMQQRVGLARAFATEAPILLMDEPFSALDPLIRNHLQDELLGFQKSLKRTIIFVSHDLDEAVKIGSRIAIMEGGRIIQTGTPQEIVLNPANDYVANFIGHMNPLHVLRAQEIMGEIMSGAEKAGSEAPSVAPETPMRELISQLMNGVEELSVKKDGKVIGRITQEHIFNSLLRGSSGAVPYKPEEATTA